MEIDFTKAIDNDAIDKLSEAELEEVLSILTEAGY